MNRKSAQIEYEAKVLNIDPVEIDKKLKKIGAIKKDVVLHRRYVFNTIPYDEDKWLRLRSNGEKHTLTVKKIDDDSVTGTKEWETEVGDFETTLEILLQTGVAPKAYQENRRTDYELEDVIISLDEWPMIKPYIEIEGPSEESVLRAAKKLGYTEKDLTSINTSKVYKHYGIDTDKIKELKF